MLHLIGTIIIGFVAGVRPGAGLVLDLVGQERYQFDIWGDTVNVAALMVGMSAREAWL